LRVNTVEYNKWTSNANTNAHVMYTDAIMSWSLYRHYNYCSETQLYRIISRLFEFNYFTRGNSNGLQLL